MYNNKNNQKEESKRRKNPLRFTQSNLKVVSPEGFYYDGIKIVSTVDLKEKTIKEIFKKYDTPTDLSARNIVFGSILNQCRQREGSFIIKKKEMLSRLIYEACKYSISRNSIRVAILDLIEYGYITIEKIPGWRMEYLYEVRVPMLDRLTRKLMQSGKYLGTPIPKLYKHIEMKQKLFRNFGVEKGCPGVIVDFPYLRSALLKVNDEEGVGCRIKMRDSIVYEYLRYLTKKGTKTKEKVYISRELFIRVHPSVACIAIETGLTENQVHTSIKNLNRLGILCIENDYTDKTMYGNLNRGTENYKPNCRKANTYIIKVGEGLENIIQTFIRLSGRNEENLQFIKARRRALCDDFERLQELKKEEGTHRTEYSLLHRKVYLMYNLYTKNNDIKLESFYRFNEPLDYIEKMKRVGCKPFRYTWWQIEDLTNIYNVETYIPKFMD